MTFSAALKLARALNVKVKELFAENQSLAANDQAPTYAVLANQVSERSLLPFIIYPPAEFSDAVFLTTLGEFLHADRKMAN